MPAFGVESLKQRATIHADLQRLFDEVIKYYDCKIMEGHRGEAAQNEAYAKGNSKLKFPHGKHNSYPSKAVDVYPYPIDMKDTARFYFFAGYVKATADRLGIKIRWGGDWDSDGNLKENTFNDLVHFELV